MLNWKVLVALLLTFASWQQLNAQSVISAEYFIDVDPGPGNGTPFSITPGDSVYLDHQFSIAGLSPGSHVLYTRAINSNGLWSVAERRFFFIQESSFPIDSSALEHTIVAAEYFIDVDPGPGNGTPFSVTPGDSVYLDHQFSIAGLSPGSHVLYTRVINSNGLWSVAERRFFFIQESSFPIDSSALEHTIIAAEYFIDVDPGPGNGTPFSVTPGDSVYLDHQFSIAGLSPGSHVLHVRSKSSKGLWSVAERNFFFIQEITPPYDSLVGSYSIDALEYFIGADPGPGLGTPIPFSLTGDSIVLNAAVQVPCLPDGQYFVHLRARTSQGLWSVVSRDTLNISGSLVSASVQTLGSNTAYAPSPVILYVDSAAGMSYQWFLNGNPIPGAQSALYAAIVSGTYSVEQSCGANTVMSVGIEATIIQCPVITVNEQSASACDSYVWALNNQTYIQSGSYTYLNGCTTEVLNLTIIPADTIVTTASACGSYTWAVNGSVYTASGTYVSISGCTVSQLEVVVSPTVNDTAIVNACDSYEWPLNNQTYTLSGSYSFNGACATSLLILNISTSSVITSTALACGSYVWPLNNQTYTTSGTYTSVLGCSTEVLNLTVTPISVELCNGLDDDCDGLIDEGLVYLNYFIDADADGFGAGAGQLSCIQPAGFVANNLDCNDSNSAIKPSAQEICDGGVDNDCDGLVDDADPSVTGRVTRYVDNDGDGYGAGPSVLVCPQTPGYSTNNTDCNDNNPAINPAAQTLTFSGSPGFATGLINPESGTPYTNFSFEVVYTDSTNALPPATFPRAYLDFEGNGVFNNSKDRVVIMSPNDVGDTTTSDGKLYIATVNALAIGTNWQTQVQVINGSCVTRLGPFNYPDVQVAPDLQIFANDISFSDPNPAVSSALTVSAIIHNVSDFPAQNFSVRMINQYDNTSPADILVSYLAPQSSQTVQWTITTPSVPAWCPIQVLVDHTNVIVESNEFDNSAIRPFINGNYNLPGGITVVNPTASPAASYAVTGSTTTISGRGFYFGTAIPLVDSSVAGGAISFTIVETGASYTTTTNSNGNFSKSVPTPLIPGTYTISGTLTDFTLTGAFSAQFTVLPPPSICTLPELSTSLNVSSTSIVQGNSISGSIVVRNTSTLEQADASECVLNQTGGFPTLSNITVPALPPGAAHTTNFAGIVFNTPGTFSICATADGTFQVDECSETNNTACRTINVIPALPDIYPTGGPSGTVKICTAPGSVSFTVRNSGGAATGSFNCEVIVKENNVVVGTYIRPISNIPALNGSATISVPVTYSLNPFSFELRCDVPLPGGVVQETNENNNTSFYSQQVSDCRPNLYFQSCESFDVAPVDPQFPGTVTYSAVIANNGDAPATGPIAVRFELSGGAVYATTHSGNLNPGQSATVSTTQPSVAPATQTITATVDPDNTILEWNENNNSISGSLCWDFQPTSFCSASSNFWSKSYSVNQNVSLSVGLRNHFLYDASSVKLRFKVSGPGLTGMVTLGDAVVNNVQQTCSCPYAATLPVAFTFPQVGVYTFTMVADPDEEYTECNESNNVLVVQVNVVSTPDMRILSQYINPSMLNPQPGDSITMDITYENIGASNLNSQMKLTVLVDEVPFYSVFPVNGLVSGDNATVPIPAYWSTTLPGLHVVRAIIDSDNQIAESNELNNEATRAVIVGELANLYFQALSASNPNPNSQEHISITARIGNNGDLPCDAVLEFYYRSDAQDTLLIGAVPVSLQANDSIILSIPWTVLDPTTTIIGRIVNSSILEATYEDNEATTALGSMQLSLPATAVSCNSSTVALVASISGGDAPYLFTWNNQVASDTFNATPGVYTLVVTDITGQTVAGTVQVVDNPGLIYFADSDGDGYGSGDSTLTLVSCTGAPAGYVPNQNDCDDTEDAVNPAAVEICDGSIDNDCDGLADDADPIISGQSGYYADMDGDGYGGGIPVLACVQPVNTYLLSQDCDDMNATVNPAVVEYCNQIDDDCNGLIDDGLLFTTYFADVDGDGYGDPGMSSITCDDTPSGYLSDNTDCNDNDALINPSAQEICDGGIDNDCNGAADNADTAVIGQLIYYADLDSDGYGNPLEFMLSCQLPLSQFTNNNSDCDDSDPMIFPGAPELCDGRDNNCNVLIDDSCLVDVRARFFIEGFYLENGEMMEVLSPGSQPSLSDSVQMFLADIASPYDKLYAGEAILKKNGDVTFYFPADVLGESFYLVIRHRNAIETWSKSPVQLQSGLYYNFSVSGQLPQLMSTLMGLVQSQTAIFGGTVYAEGSSAVTERGVCWSTSPSPSIALSTKTNDGGGMGNFTSSLSGLMPGTTYYLRAYATNASGTAYGNEIRFTTKY